LVRVFLRLIRVLMQAQVCRDSNKTRTSRENSYKSKDTRGTMSFFRLVRVLVQPSCCRDSIKNSYESSKTCTSFGRLVLVRIDQVAGTVYCSDSHHNKGHKHQAYCIMVHVPPVKVLQLIEALTRQMTTSSTTWGGY
jgi:hypothetical protein